MSRLLALGLAAALALGACGKKGAPIAPQLVRPESPESLSAITTAEGIRLSWNRPQRYSGGRRMNDLGGFFIDRAPDGNAPAPTPFTRVGNLELTDQTRFRKERRLEWLDRDVSPGERYLYRVIAVTLDGYKSNPAGPVSIRFGPGETPPPATEPATEPAKEPE